MGQSFKKLYTNKRDFIAYKEQIYHKNKKSVLWFGGLNSDMSGTKAQYLSSFSKKIGLIFLGLIILVMEDLPRNLIIVSYQTG